MRFPALFLLLGLGLGAVAGARADVKLPAIFGDHMVLQQDVRLPVWGTADPGEEIAVTVGERQGKAVADANGQWRVDLDPLPVTRTPVEVQVSGRNTLRFTDVLIGDVWLCSGQSNMEFGIGNAPNAAAIVPQFNFPSLRLFLVPHRIAFEPQADIVRDNLKGQWVVCTPENIVKVGGWNGFSAVGLFFAKELQAARPGQPLGLIGAYWGGTAAQSWTSLEATRAEPALSGFVSEFEKTRDNWAAILDAYRTTTLPKWEQEHEAWKQKTAQAAPGSPATPEPEPKKPNSPDAYPQFPVILFDGMIAPLIPYSLKGVLWYQGESNNGGQPYAKMLETLIGDWRRRWGQGDFPFLLVQIPSWAEGDYLVPIRDAQLKTLSMPNTGLAVTIDLGEEHDVHPKEKSEVGRRLALLARRVAYGEDLVASGPLYASAQEEGGKMRVGFSRVGSGLAIGVTPAPAGAVPGAVADRLVGFEVAGTDNRFVPAQAQIEGDSVLVWSDAVPQPKAVRYGHTGYARPPLNLYNKEGLPASPFDTQTSTPVAGK